MWIEEDIPEEVDKVSLYAQLKLFINLSGPTVIVNVLGQLQWIISSSFAGQNQGTEVLAAISMTMLGAMLGRTMAVGLISGLDTLLGNMMGEGNYVEVGYLTQTTLFLNVLFCIPPSLLYLNMESIFEYLGQPEDVSTLASSYMRIFILVFPIETFTEVIKAFFRCQNVTLPFVFIYLTSTILHYFLVHWIKHVMWAFLLTEYFTFFACLLVFKLKQHKVDCCQNWSVKEMTSKKRIKRILKLGLPGICSLSEWWFYDFQTVLVGTLGKEYLAAHSIGYFTIPLLFHIPYGCATAAQTRIATVIGEGRFRLAKQISFSTMGLNIFLGVNSSFWCYYFRENIFSFFLSEDDTAVRTIIHNTWPWMCSYMLFDGTLASSLGIFRGLGEHRKVAQIIIFSLWMFGIPVELFFIWVLEWKLEGLWIGLNICYLLMNSLFVVSLLRYKYAESSVKYSSVETDEFDIK